MKRVRSAWVLLTNGTAIYLLFRGTQQDALLNNLLEQASRNRGLWFHFALWAAVPALGIALELFSSRLSKWVNLGYFAYFGVVFSVMGILNLPDHHALISLAFGILASSVACVNYLLYRRPRSTPVGLLGSKG